MPTDVRDAHLPRSPPEGEAIADVHASANVARAASACVVLAWAIACLPLVIHGFPHGQDASFELFRIAGYRNALAEGQWLPYWGGGFFVGYGSPIYVFYAPAFMALASALSFLSGSVLSGAVIAAAACLALCAYGAHRGASAAFSSVAPALRHQLACVSAGALVLHPYLLGNLYLRNALAEFAAVCLFPLTLASALLLGDVSGRGRVRAVLGIALLLSASVLTHNLSALVAMTFLLGTALCVYGGTAARGARLVTLAAGVALGLAMAAYFWVPALGYNGITRTGIELRHGKLDFHNNFVPFLSNFGLEAFYGTGPLMPLAVCAGLGLALRRRDRAGLTAGLPWALSLFAVGIVLLQFRLSTPIWEHLPFLSLVQFPWRFWGQLGFVGALCLSLLVRPLFERIGPRAWPAVQLCVLALVAGQAAIPLMRARPLPSEVTRDFDLAATPEAMRDNPGAMATFRWEYIPPYADRELWKADPHYRGAVHHSVGPIAIQVLRDAPRAVALAVEVPGASAAAGQPVAAVSAVVFRRWLFPGFEAALDGQPVPVEASPQGLAAVAVPAGAHRLVLTLGPPPLRRLAEPISAMATLGWLLLYLRQRRRWPAVERAGAER